MQHSIAGPVERRIAGRWDRLSDLTGLALGGRYTGWDRLAGAILDDPAIRLKAICRMEAVVCLCRLVSRLSETHFVVLALRFGLSVDDQIVEERTRRDVSETVQRSMSRIAQIEHEAINELRRRATTEFPAIADYVYHAGVRTEGVAVR